MNILQYLSCQIDSPRLQSFMEEPDDKNGGGKVFFVPSQPPLQLTQ